MTAPLHFSVRAAGRSLLCAPQPGGGEECGGEAIAAGGRCSAPTTPDDVPGVSARLGWPAGSTVSEASWCGICNSAITQGRARCSKRGRHMTTALPTSPDLPVGRLPARCQLPAHPYRAQLVGSQGALGILHMPVPVPLPMHGARQRGAQVGRDGSGGASRYGSDLACPVYPERVSFTRVAAAAPTCTRVLRPSWHCNRRRGHRRILSFSKRPPPAAHIGPGQCSCVKSIRDYLSHPQYLLLSPKPTLSASPYSLPPCPALRSLQNAPSNSFVRHQCAGH